MLINSLIRCYLCGMTHQTKRGYCARSPLEAKQLVYQGKTTRPTRQIFNSPTRLGNIQSPNEANRPTTETFNRPMRQTIQSPNEASKHSIAQVGLQTFNRPTRQIAKRGKHSIAQRGKPFNRRTR